jgi:hypothetical protein
MKTMYMRLYSHLTHNLQAQAPEGGKNKAYEVY